MKSNMKNRAQCCGLTLFAVALLFAASYGAGQCAAMAYVSAYDSEWMPFQTMPPLALYRGDAQRTGVFAEDGIREMHGIRWQKHFGEAAHAGPVFADGVIYLPNGDGRIRAIDTATGEVLWAYRAKPESSVFSSVALADGVVYAGIEGNRLYALDAHTGDVLWKVKTKGIVWTAPLVVGDSLYFASQNGFFYAVSISMQAQQWKLKIKRESLWPAVYDNGTIFFAAESVLYALDAATGGEKWRLERPAAQWWGPPAFADGMLYAGSGDGRFYAIDAATGTAIWSAPANSDVWSAPAIADQMVYVGNRDTFVRAFDAKTGELIWHVQLEDWAVTDPVIAGNVIYVAVGNHEGQEGPRHLYALDRQTGAELWTFQADSRILSAPGVGDGAIYVQAFSGTLYAVE